MSKQFCVIKHWEVYGGTWFYDLAGVTNNWCEAVGMAEIAFDDALEQDKKDARSDKEELEILYEDHCWFDGEDGSWRWTAATRRKGRKNKDLLTVLILEKEDVCSA